MKVVRTKAIMIIGLSFGMGFPASTNRAERSSYRLALSEVAFGMMAGGEFGASVSRFPAAEDVARARESIVASPLPQWGEHVKHKVGA